MKGEGETMSVLADLSDCDLRALMALVDDGHNDEPGEGMPWAVLDGLLHLVPCDQVAFNDMNLHDHQPIVLQSVEGGVRRMMRALPAIHEPKVG